ncbi:MAG: aminoglycoside phosphotransferase family protein, partial [Streptomyces sp.]|nr:aminoglycoside phosphotransferase family protein [Streptomyces sp.]
MPVSRKSTCGRPDRPATIRQVTVPRKHLSRTDLAPLAHAALGPTRTLTAVARLRGGTRKGVYRLAFEDGTTAVAYVWSAEEDYWDTTATATATDPADPGGPGDPHDPHDPADPRDPFSHATGLDLFTAAHDRLAAAGVRTPRLLYADASHTHLPADAAIVEDLAGDSLEALLSRDPQAAPRAMERFAELLGTLHAVTGPRFGKVGLVDSGGSSHDSACARRVADGALRSIETVAVRDPRIGAVREELADLVRELAAEVRPRSRHTLIHGELGPDHVLLTPDGQPALIDIEGLLYADVEHEHVFLRLRFGRHYDALRVPDRDGLDDHRLRLYRLAMHLGLVAGPLRLLDGDYPDPAPMRAIAEHNLREV